jgi:hypothetical protein
MASNYNKDLAHLTGMERVPRFSSGADGRIVDTDDKLYVTATSAALII